MCAQAAMQYNATLCIKSCPDILEAAKEVAQTDAGSFKGSQPWGTLLLRV